MKALVLQNPSENSLVSVGNGDKVFDELSGSVVTVIDVISKYQLRVSNEINMGIRNGWEVSKSVIITCGYCEVHCGNNWCVTNK